MKEERGNILLADLCETKNHFDYITLSNLHCVNLNGKNQTVNLYVAQSVDFFDLFSSMVYLW